MFGISPLKPNSKKRQASHISHCSHKTGSFYKQLASVGYGCLSGNMPCKPASLIDLPHLLDRSSSLLSHVERYRTATAGYDTYLALGNTLLVVSGLSSVFVPVKMGILGMFVLVFGLWMSEMTPLPTFVFFCMLIVFSAVSEKEAEAQETNRLKKASSSKVDERVVTPSKNPSKTGQDRLTTPKSSGKSKKHK